LALYAFDATGQLLAEGTPQHAAFALLVPLAAWVPHGLERLFGPPTHSSTASTLSRNLPLLVPVSRAHSAALLDLLPTGNHSRHIGLAPEKLLLQLGVDWLADSGLIVLQEGIPYLRLWRRRRVDLLIAPGSYGDVELGLKLPAPPSKAHVAALRIGFGAREAGFVWYKDSLQLRLQARLDLGTEQEPARLSLRDIRPAEEMGGHLLIRNLEINVARLGLGDPRQAMSGARP
jgi:hypothetical protein